MTRLRAEVVDVGDVDAARTPSRPCAVRAPGSSANMGPGFDALGLALDRYAAVGVIDGPLPDGASPITAHHPAAGAFAASGGSADLWSWTDLPMGRGLGYSGAVRVAGAALAHVVDGADPTDPVVREAVLAVATDLEGHADNAAASVHGGMTVAAGGRALRVPMEIDPAIVMWIPDATTSTDRSRRRLGPSVPLVDATHGIGHAALLVAAVATGAVDALRAATDDRLHQPGRLAEQPDSAAALRAGLSAGAWCGWLSGSGPSIAFMCAEDDAGAVVAALPPGGRARRLGVDQLGVTAIDVAGAGSSSG